jgi:PAS domain S-box-containing protein
MPEMDGFEVVRRIRDDPEICDIPVIMVTVLDDRDTRLRAVQSGANDFIGKPIDRIEVSVRVESLLKMKEAQDQIKRHHTKLEDAVEKRTAELAESERRFRIMADFSQDLEYWQGTDGQLIYVSPSCERITGYSPNELKADPDLLNRIIHPDDRALVMLHSKEVHGGLNGDQGSFNFRIVSKDKRVVWVNHVCRSVVGEQGEWLGTRVDNRNVTPQKLLEDALEKTRKLLGLVMDSLPVAIFYLDSEQRFGMANQTFRSWWGRSKDDFAGLTIS